LRTPAVGICRTVVMAGIRKRSQVQKSQAHFLMPKADVVVHDVVRQS